MKWVVFMNFWLEYVHSTATGTGYKMNNSAPEVIGQMFIDDSNWQRGDMTCSADSRCPTGQGVGQDIGQSGHVLGHDAGQVI